MADDGVRIDVVLEPRTAAFRAAHEREARSTMWGFTVVWHEQRHELAALENEDIVGVLGLRIVASLAHVESLFVARSLRRRRIGARLLERAETLANYYNCHKMTLEAPAGPGPQGFFEACGYRVEATLAQHTWKRDVVVMRKFLL